MSEPILPTSNQNTGRDPNAQGPSPLDLLQRENERLRAALKRAYSRWSHAQEDTCETAGLMADDINAALTGNSFAPSISKLCKDGSHEWCMNRSAEESRCQCDCHKSAPETKTRQLSATERLHNLCDSLSEQADESPFTREEWEAVDRQTARLNSALRNLIDAVRNVEIEKRPWDLFMALPLQNAYRALKHQDALTEVVGPDGSPLETPREHLHWCAIHIGKGCNCHADDNGTRCRAQNGKGES